MSFSLSHLDGMEFERIPNTHSSCKRMSALLILANLSNMRLIKGVFPGGLIQSPIINALLLPDDHSIINKFLFLIFYNGHSLFLGQDLCRAHPFTIRDRIDDPSVKKFYNLLFHDALHVRVQASLGLPRRYMVIIKKNAMYAN